MIKFELAHKYLLDSFNNSEYLNNNPHSKNYRYEHSIRVANIGRVIAEEEGFDVEAFMVACLLHDISYVEEFKKENDWLGHGRRAAYMVKDFIESLGFAREVTNDILYGIAIHVDDVSDFLGVRTPFALAICDADNIDRFDTYRIFETLKYEKFDELSLDEKMDVCRNRLSNLKRLLSKDYATPTSTKLFHEKLEFQLSFYSRLLLQLEASEL